MTTIAKITIGIISGVILLFALIIGGAVLFGYLMTDEKVEREVKEQRAEGANFGKNVDQAGCISEGLRRAKSIRGLEFKKNYPLSVFIRSCLPESRPAPGFCDPVPADYDFARTEKWKTEQCEAANLDEASSGCAYVFEQQINFCSRRS